MSSESNGSIPNSTARPSEITLKLLADFLNSEVGRVLAIPGEQMPMPYRKLLVHQRDMTSTLARFHQEYLEVRTLNSRRDHTTYSREVALVGIQSGKIHEFGAIRVYLNRLPKEAQELVLEARKPFGAILNDLVIPYRSAPSGYFQIDPSPEILQAIGLDRAQALFGRQNTLSNPNGEPLAEIVEILPPEEPVSCETTTCGQFDKQMTTYDALIIGGGPSGSSAAAMLAEKGHKPLVIEREKFPRYHVGESLIPFTGLPIERLGLRPLLEKSAFTRKHSVQFVSPDGRASSPFYFSDRYPDHIAQTWQVLRSEFDELLLNHARDRGAAVLEETKVTELIEEDDQIVGVRAVSKDGKELEFRAPITLDCTGKESFAASRLRWRKKDPFLNKVAVWTYFKGAKRDPGIDEGATTVAFIPEKGWFWYIPLHDDMASVGVVADGKYLTRDGERDLERIFYREVEQNAWIKEYTSHGTQTGAFRITNEFSYHADHCYKPGLLLVGDAFAFLDPVFSSGLMLALKSGVMAADTISECLTANDFSPERFEAYGRELREGIENMRKLVYAFYAPDFSFGKLTKAYPEIAPLVTDCLSGDVNKDFTELFDKVAEFAEIPDPLPVGAPLGVSAIAAT